VRSNVSKVVWDRLRRQMAVAAGNRCEACGGRGRRWPVECHEVCDYDDVIKVQRLERRVALCPARHEVEHARLASKRDRLDTVIKRLAKVNGWGAEDAAVYLEAVFEQWAARTRQEWSLDISVRAEREWYGPAGGSAIDGGWRREPGSELPNPRHPSSGDSVFTPSRRLGSPPFCLPSAIATRRGERQVRS